MKSPAIKIFLVCVSFALFLLALLLVSPLGLFIASPAKRRLVSRLIQLFDKALIKIIGIRVKVSGRASVKEKQGKGIFFVSNHLSYIDGFVLGALFPIIYISKSELKGWPLIGLMSDFSGTLFIDRKRRNHVAEYVKTIADTLEGRANILFFPEGTSSNGDSLLPFKPAFFEAPIITGSATVPLSLVYVSVDGKPLVKENRDMVYWHGDMTFAGHFFRLLSCRGIEVEVKVHEPIFIQDEGDRGVSRKQVSELAFEAIRKGICRNRA